MAFLSLWIPASETQVITLVKERFAKYNCISCNISVSNIYSTAGNVDSDGYNEEGKKVKKCSS